MASFEKLAAKKSTRADMMKQIKDLDLDNDAPSEPDADADDNDVNKPGSKAYIKRRDKQAEEDFRNIPRRSR